VKIIIALCPRERRVIREALERFADSRSMQVTFLEFHGKTPDEKRAHKILEGDLEIALQLATKLKRKP
jgi:hypothetical protein